MLSHANLLWCGMTLVAALAVDKDAILAYAPPMFHVAGSPQPWPFSCWAASHHSRLQPQALAACIARERATDVASFPR